MRAEVASDTLVALARNHFGLVVYVLQHCLRPLNLAEEFVIVTLAKLANGNGRPRGASALVSDRFQTIPCSCQASALVSAPPPCISYYLSLPFLLFISACLSVPLSRQDSLSVLPPPISVSLFLSSLLFEISLSSLPVWPRSLTFCFPPSLSIARTCAECLIRAGLGVGAGPQVSKTP